MSISSSISTDTPGRVDKAQVLQAVQQSGESYDAARETLKHVSVDASGKLEVEDWVEVRCPTNNPCTILMLRSAQREATTIRGAGACHPRREGHCPGVKCERQSYAQRR
jgi:plastin-1